MELHVQWYPGHMARARRQLLEALPRVDAILEVADARAPRSSRHPELPELARGKPRVVLFAKEDLADPQVSRQWLQWVRAQGERALLANLREGGWIARTVRLLRSAARTRRRAATLRTMVVGIPNVGKSTAINALARRKGARTGDVPGVTRGPQWIRGEGGIEWLDTPGLLWPRLDDDDVRFALAVTGAIPDRLLDEVDVARRLVAFLSDAYPDALPQRYGPVSPDDGSLQHDRWLHHVAQRRHLLSSGGETDIVRAASVLLQDFRKGRLGRISLETPPLRALPEKGTP